MSFDKIRIGNGVRAEKVIDIIHREQRRHLFEDSDDCNPKVERSKTLAWYGDLCHAPIGALLNAASLQPFVGEPTDRKVISDHLQGYVYAKGDPAFAEALNSVLPTISGQWAKRKTTAGVSNCFVARIDVEGAARRLAAVAKTEPEFVLQLLKNDFESAAEFCGNSGDSIHRSLFGEVYLLWVLAQVQAGAAFLHKQTWDDNPLFPQLKRSPNIGATYVKLTNEYWVMAKQAYALFATGQQFTTNKQSAAAAKVKRFAIRKQLLNSPAFKDLLKRYGFTDDEVKKGLPNEHPKMIALAADLDQSRVEAEAIDHLVKQKVTGTTALPGEVALISRRAVRRCDRRKIVAEMKSRASLPRSVAVIGEVPATALAYVMAQLVWIVSRLDALVDCLIGGAAGTFPELGSFSETEKRAWEALLLLYNSVILRDPYHVPLGYKSIKHSCPGTSAVIKQPCRCLFIERERAPVGDKHRYAFGAGLTIEDKVPGLNPCAFSSDGQIASRHAQGAVVEALALLEQRQRPEGAMSRALSEYMDLLPFARAFPLRS